jgi:hypothetical protein
MPDPQQTDTRVRVPNDFNIALDQGGGNPDAGDFLNRLPTPGVSVDLKPVDPYSSPEYQAFLRRQGVSSGRANQVISDRLDALNLERTRFMEDRELALQQATEDQNLRRDARIQQGTDAIEDSRLGLARGNQNLDIQHQLGTRNTNLSAQGRGVLRSSQRVADLTELEREVLRSRTRLQEDADTNIERSQREIDQAQVDADRVNARLAFADERGRLRFERDFQKEVDEIEEQRARNAASAAAARNAALLRARQSMENARAQVLAPRFVPDERDPRTGGLAKSQRRRAINPHRRRGSSSSSSFFS